MKSLGYNSYQKVCSQNTPVILCVDSSATVSGLPYIDGTVVSVDGQVDSRGCQMYIYGITYEETQLINTLLDPVITGLIERNCLTSYIDSRTTASDFYVNVKSFGALGNGTQNDTSFIQAAINAANAAGGGTVFFPVGRYKVTTSITTYPGILLQGSGMAVAQNTYATQPTYYKGTVIDGRTVTGDVVAFNGTGLNSQGFGIRDLTVVAGTANGISITQADSLVLVNVSAQGAPTNFYGIKLVNLYGRSQIDNIDASFNTGTGLYLDACNAQNLGKVVANNNCNAGNPYSVVINSGLQTSIRHLAVSNSNYGALKVDNVYGLLISSLYTERNNIANAGVYEVLLGNITNTRKIEITDWYQAGPYSNQYFSGAAIGVKETQTLKIGTYDNLASGTFFKGIAGSGNPKAVLFQNINTSNTIDYSDSTWQGSRVTFESSLFDESKVTKSADTTTTIIGCKYQSYGYFDRSVSSNTTLNCDDRNVYADSTAGSINVTLPADKVYCREFTYTIIKTVAGNNVVIKTTPGGDVTLASQYARAQFRTNGTSWYQVA